MQRGQVVVAMAERLEKFASSDHFPAALYLQYLALAVEKDDN